MPNSYRIDSSANTENQLSDFTLNQQKKPLLKTRRNCLNIIAFFQQGKYNRNVTETNKIFPLHVFNIPLYHYLLQTLLLVCFICLLSGDVWLPVPLGKACSLCASLSQSSLHVCLFLNTTTEKTAVCCLHSPEKLHKFY